MGAAAIPVGLMVASAASGYAGARKQKQAYNSAEGLANEGRADFLRRNASNIGSLFNFSENLYGPGRGEQWDQDAKQYEARRMGELEAAGPQQQISGDATNPDALAFAGRKAVEEGERTAKIMRLLSKVQAPGQAQFREGKAYGNFSSDYGSRLQDAGNMSRAFGVDTEQRYNQAGNAGSGWRLLSDLFAKGAQAYGMGAFGGAAGAASRAYPVGGMAAGR
jgi:hypothetical protein